MIKTDQTGRHQEGVLAVPDQRSFATMIDPKMLKIIIAAMERYTSALYLRVTADGKLIINGYIGLQPAGALIAPMAPVDDDGQPLEPWKYHMYKN